MEKKKIDLLIWVKGVDEGDEGNILRDAVMLKRYTDDIVVVAGPPDKLLTPAAKRELLGHDAEDVNDDSSEGEEDGK
jgi:hypothetical protein